MLALVAALLVVAEEPSFGDLQALAEAVPMPAPDVRQFKGEWTAARQVLEERFPDRRAAIAAAYDGFQQCLVDGHKRMLQQLVRDTGRHLTPAQVRLMTAFYRDGAAKREAEIKGRARQGELATSDKAELGRIQSQYPVEAYTAAFRIEADKLQKALQSFGTKRIEGPFGPIFVNQNPAIAIRESCDEGLNKAWPAGVPRPNGFGKFTGSGREQLIQAGKGAPLPSEVDGSR